MQLAAALAIVLTTSAAMAQASRPDPAVTPGSVNPNVTQFTIATTICSPGWARSVRPSRKFTSYLKHRQLAGLGYPDQRMRDYEEDHLIPLSLAVRLLTGATCGRNRGAPLTGGRQGRRTSWKTCYTGWFARGP